MTVLSDYAEFNGLHWETGTVRNVLAYQGIKAPHTGKPYSEALLMGVSGGAAFGYFLFDYKGHDPILSLITRNTFDPLETLFERLGIPQTVLQSTDPHKGEVNLLKILESGRPAIVWADMFSLPYNALQYDENNWSMFPVVVFGSDDEQVYIADRSSQALTVSKYDFEKARGRVKKDKFRVISLDSPDEGKLVSAVQKGLWQCIRLFTETPPKGTRNNFGFAAYRHWAQMLTNTRNPQGWTRFFPPGSRLYAALAGFNPMTGVYGWARIWGAGQGAERGMYADFLNEAAVILNRPGLNRAADLFRESQASWFALSETALPEEIPLLKETRGLIQRRHDLFIHQGDAVMDQIHHIDRVLSKNRMIASQEFPISPTAVTELFACLQQIVLKIHDIEVQAVEAVQSSIA